MGSNEAAVEAPTMPYLNEQGDIVIPFNAPLKYQWWKEGGQSLAATIIEFGNDAGLHARYTKSALNAPPEVK